jgi:hypothetical protein
MYALDSPKIDPMHMYKSGLKEADFLASRPWRRREFWHHASYAPKWMLCYESHCDLPDVEENGIILTLSRSLHFWGRKQQQQQKKKQVLEDDGPKKCRVILHRHGILGIPKNRIGFFKDFWRKIQVLKLVFGWLLPTKWQKDDKFWTISKNSTFSVTTTKKLNFRLLCREIQVSTCSALVAAHKVTKKKILSFFRQRRCRWCNAAKKTETETEKLKNKTLRLSFSLDAQKMAKILAKKN